MNGRYFFDVSSLNGVGTKRAINLPFRVHCLSFFNDIFYLSFLFKSRACVKKFRETFVQASTAILFGIRRHFGLNFHFVFRRKFHCAFGLPYSCEKHKMSPVAQNLFGGAWCGTGIFVLSGDCFHRSRLFLPGGTNCEKTS